MPIATLATEHRDHGNKRHLAWLRVTLAVDAKKYDALIAAYLELHKGDTGRAIRAVNTACGTCYARGEIGKWGRLERRAPEHIRDHMRTEVLRSRFDRETADALCRLLDINTAGTQKVDSLDDGLV